MQDPGSWIQAPGCWIHHPGSRALDLGSWILDTGSWIHPPGSWWFQDPGYRMDSGICLKDAGSRIMDPGRGPRIRRNSGPRIQEAGSRVLDQGSRIRDPRSRIWIQDPESEIRDSGSWDRMNDICEGLMNNMWEVKTRDIWEGRRYERNNDEHMIRNEKRRTYFIWEVKTMEIWE